MTNATLGANAPAMSIDRRTALTRVGALLTAAPLAAAGFPSTAEAQSLDADLFALARRVKELSLERDRAYDVLSELRDSFELKPPASLLRREGDERLAGVRDGEFAGIGKPFSQEQLKVIRMMRPMFQSLSAAESFGPDLQAKFSAGLDRILEIDFAAAQYQSDLKASREAAGITAAKARYDSIDDLLGMTRRDLAFTRALTALGRYVSHFR